jgi:predicted nucleic acid-binding protein
MGCILTGKITRSLRESKDDNQPIKADCIVSGDKKHLLALKEYEGMPILSPADFLRRLG